MSWEIEAVDDAPPPIGCTDYAAIKADIVARLDVAAEFTALGVEFTQPAPDGRGWRKCRAFGRTDHDPNAGVHIPSGTYHDFSADGGSLSLFDFALKHGDHGRWIEVIKHYASKAGVVLDDLKTHGKGRIREAVYEYFDVAGELRYVVFRYRLANGKKEFTQHPPDGRGGWKVGPGCMEGVAPLPYRLPDLIGAPSDATVYICEGEKDCDRLAALGLVATTNHMGCGATDRTWPRFLDHFKDRTCVVIPDNDPGGKLHAAKVAGYLRGVARGVKVVELPGLATKGDVSDWLDTGHDVAELNALVAAAPEWDPVAAGQPEPPDDPTRDATVADLRRQMAAEAWAWPLWIPNAALTLLASEPGIGKTRFCHDLHRRIALGLPWPDGTPMNLPAGSKVLWVAADAQHREMIQIAPAFGIPDDLIVLNATAINAFGGTSLQNQEEWDDFEARIERVKPALVFIDTITNTADYKSQDSSDAKRQYKPLQEIALRRRVPIVCVTHLNAGGKVLGRRAVEKVRTVIQIEKPDPDGQPNRRKIWVSKTFDHNPAPLGVTMGDGGNEYDPNPPVAPEAETFGRPRAQDNARRDVAADFLRDAINGTPRRVADLRRDAEAVGIDAKTLYRARDAIGIEEFTIDNRKWWRFPPQAEDEPGVVPF